jgi:ABC-type multidrug transport system fused ATPase/permease subunit
MKNINNILEILSFYWNIISKRRRFQIILLQFLNIISSFFELLTIASIFPFVSAIINPLEFQLKVSQKIKFFPNLYNKSDFILYIVVSFVILNLSSAIIRIISSYLNSKIPFIAGSDIGQQIYKNTLMQNYEYHTLTNSSDLISIIGSKTGTIITNALMPAFNLISSFFIFIFIIISLLLFDFNITVSMIIIFLFIYIIIVQITKPKLIKEGLIISKETDVLMRKLQESFGGIREIILNNSHFHQIENYNYTERKLRNSQSSSIVLVSLPRFIIEPSGLIMLALITYYLYLNNYSSDKIISILAVLTMSIQRLLPNLQQIYSNWSTITNSLPALKDTITMLGLRKSIIQVNPIEKFPWKDSINLQNVSFKYQTRNNFILKDINLTINKGSIVGFIGKSGEGKSTLIDLITGLINPIIGQISIDNIILENLNDYSKWRNEISVVSQRIFLLDKSFEENIAFGIEKKMIDKIKLYNAISMANLDQTIINLPLGVETVIGERGIQLSGGQLQRIGLARAFYKDASILILDEATNALDSNTESEIINTIKMFKDNFTILMITHNSLNLKICDQIYEIKNSNLFQIK